MGANAWATAKAKGEYEAAYDKLFAMGKPVGEDSRHKDREDEAEETELEDDESGGEWDESKHPRDADGKFT